VHGRADCAKKTPSGLKVASSQPVASGRLGLVPRLRVGKHHTSAADVPDPTKNARISIPYRIAIWRDHLDHHPSERRHSVAAVCCVHVPPGAALQFALAGCVHLAR